MPDFDNMGHVTPDEDIEAFRELIYAVGSRGPEPGPPWYVVVEVGVWAGYMTRCLVEDKEVRVYAVDNWSANNFAGQSSEDPSRKWIEEHGSDAAFATFCRNMGDLLFRRVIPLRGGSLLWASIWPKHLPIDLVIIDANKQETRQDIEAWTPHVHQGGIIAGHDLLDNDVYLAVQETGNYHEATQNVWWRRKGE